MCAIAGTFAYGADAPPVDHDELVAMRDRMMTRGPDGAGEWISADGRVGLAHRRLTIIDLTEAGAQPMFSADGALGITFNGEIYNYAALRAGLAAKGHQFRSTSDTEVLLHLYAEKGEAMLHDLRGMYAFAIWDARKRGLFLARDPFGIKPLYYADRGGVMRFASQVKALLASKQVDTAPEPAGHVGFFLWGSVPAPYTMYAGIRELPAGHSVWVEPNACREPRPFCDINDILRGAHDAERSAETAASHEVLRAALSDSVAQHLIADVPVGVFLSAGLDSTTLAAFATAHTGQVRSVTLGFDEYRGAAEDEVPLAEATASALRAQHETVRVSQRDFAAQTEHLFGAMDQPSIDGVNTYFVSLAARRAGLKVALSGVGGDELFGGYSSFREIPKTVRTIGKIPAVASIGRGLRVLTAPVMKRFTSPKYAGLLEYGGSFGGAYLLRRGLFMPWELPEVLDPDFVRNGWERLRPVARLEQTTTGIRSPRAKVSALELSWYMRHQLLRDSDWASMAHSLEIRVPLVDVQLLRQIAPDLVSNSPPTKRAMAEAAGAALPRELLDRPKTGFNVPVRDWLLKSDESNGASRARGLRGWAQHVYTRYTGLPVRSSRGPRRRIASASDGSKQPRRILIYRIGQLGDTIVALPAMWAVRHAFPQAHIALLFDKHRNARFVQSVDLLKGTKIFDQFLGYPFEAGLARKATEAAKLVATLRAQRFDTLVYLAPTTRSLARVERDQVFFRAAGIRNFIGAGGFIQVPPKSEGTPLASMPKESQLLFDRITADLPRAPEKLSFDLNLADRESQLLDSWLAKQESDGGRTWLAVGPGSKMPAKRWPLDRFRDVVGNLIAEFDIWPVVFGGPEDKAAGEELLAAWGRGYNGAGALDIRTAALGLQRSVAYLGNDTGTMHLAAAMGVTCVAIFSSREPPGMWYPHGEQNAVFRSNIECEGCCLVECVVRDNECLKRITADEVAQAAARILQLRAEPVGA